MDVHVERPADGWPVIPDDPVTGLLLVAAIALAIWFLSSAVAPIWSRPSKDRPDKDEDW